MAMESLHDVLVDQLKDLFDAEKQLVRALPKMVKAASDKNLKAAFEEHLEATRGQVERLESVFAAIGESAKGKKCEAMKGLIAEGEEVIEQKKESNPSAIDAALIAAAQKVEHYEISAYGSARTFAEVLGFDDAMKLLQESLDEESQANEKLNEVAETINEMAAEADMEEEDEEEETVASGNNSGRGRGSNGSGSRPKNGSRAR